MTTLADAFSKEDRVEVKFSDFYKMMKEGAKTELITNAINCDVPHKYIREMISGKSDIKDKDNSVLDKTVNGVVFKKQRC